MGLKKPPVQVGGCSLGGEILGTFKADYGTGLRGVNTQQADEQKAQMYDRLIDERRKRVWQSWRGWNSGPSGGRGSDWNLPGFRPGCRPPSVN
jgi:hypothetical protein